MYKTKIPPCFYRISAKAFITDDAGKVLLIFEDKAWSLPGGGVEWGETPQESLKRELQEELHLEPLKISKNPLLINFGKSHIGYPAIYLIYRVKLKSNKFSIENAQFWKQEEIYKLPKNSSVNYLFGNIE